MCKLVTQLLAHCTAGWSQKELGPGVTHDLITQRSCIDPTLFEPNEHKGQAPPRAAKSLVCIILISVTNHFMEGGWVGHSGEAVTSGKI